MELSDVLHRLSPEEVGREIRRTMHEVRAYVIANVRSLVSHNKAHYDGRPGDVFTNMDLWAQRQFEHMLLRVLPSWGIIGEEGLSRPGHNTWASPYVTIDPIDGTKALLRGDLSRVAMMLALVVRGKVVSAFVGNVASGEIIGFDPGLDTPVCQWLSNDESVNLSQLRRPGLAASAIVLRGWREEYQPLIQSIAVRSPAGVFKTLEVASGSIGVSTSLLWKAIAAAHVLKRSSYDTPWDTTPLIGISERLGMVTMRVNATGTGFDQLRPNLPTKVVSQVADTIVLHHSTIDELERFLARK